MSLKDNVTSLSTRVGQEIKAIREEISWLQLASVTSNTSQAIPVGYTNVGGMFTEVKELVITADVGGELVSTVVPSAAIDYPRTVSAYKDGVVVASVSFSSASDTTVNVSLQSGTTRVYVFVR